MSNKNNSSTTLKSDDRNRETKISKRHAFVKYQNQADAIKALEDLNWQEIMRCKVSQPKSVNVQVKIISFWQVYLPEEGFLQKGSEVTDEGGILDHQIKITEDKKRTPVIEKGDR